MKPSDKEMVNPPLRLQVFLSRSGVCSRRKAFDLVQSGCVSVNGKFVREPSTPIDPGKDKVSVNGKRIEYKTFEYILLNKPAGCVTTKSDQHKEKTVLDCLPGKFHHLSPVGRLDKNTEGLLLFTNDGDVAYTLTHPKFDIDKVYIVHAKGELSPEKTHQLERGIIIDGRKTSPAKITGLKRGRGYTEFRMHIHEGRKRQIRLMLEAVGHKVQYLKRLRQGPLVLGSLPVGRHRVLTSKEIDQLKKLNA